MKSLYESILSSTKSGAVGAVRKIVGWWETLKDSKDRGNYRVENIKGKFFIVIDDFEKQPKQRMVELKKRDVETMPKQLAGIYYTRYEQKGKEEILRPVNLHFTRCPNTTIDLSYWDMSLGPIDILDTHILIMFSSEVELVGFPKYASEFNVQLSYCDDIKTIKNINSPNGEIRFGYYGGASTIDYKDVKNCTLGRLFVDKANIIRSTVSLKHHDPSVEFCKKVGEKYVIAPQYAECIKELLKNNTIGKLRYQYSNSHDVSPLGKWGILEVQPYKTKDGIDTFAIGPMKII